MKTNIKVSKGKKTGTVFYDSSKKEITVEFSDPDVKNDIELFLSTKRDFNIPESQKIDDFRVDTASPKDNIIYFELTMCTLFANTGVHVDWKTQKDS